MRACPEAVEIEATAAKPGGKYTYISLLHLLFFFCFVFWLRSHCARRSDGYSYVLGELSAAQQG